MLPVSIIIPAHVNTNNGLLWLAECIQSAFENDCEVVVWDDGSSLDVQSIAYRMKVNKFGGNVNKGVSVARNSAIQLATQPFIFPLDCDDVLQPGSIKKLLDAWKNKPIYTDVEKFGEVVVPHFAMLDFSCEALVKHVGPYPVSVLHTKEQWASIGGYNERIDFYEDGEYNARLMFRYCGQRYPEPLLRYRFHPNQRTKKYNKSAGKYINSILPLLKEYSKMPGCCGGRNKTQFGNLFNRTSSSSNAVSVSEASVKVEFAAGELFMPLEADGKVLSRYIGGKGRGKHIYKGNTSGKPYPRVVYGSLVYADPRDVKDSDTGANGHSMLIKIKQMAAPVVLQSVQLERQPMTMEMAKEPVVEDAFTALDDEGQEFEEIEISELSLKKIMRLGLSSDDAKVFLPIEQQGKNRAGVVTYLQGLIDAS